jgi:hypothetical protein
VNALPGKGRWVLIKYSLADFDFPKVVSRALNQEKLSDIARSSRLPLLTRETDQQTPWHRELYAKFDSWKPLYTAFIHRFISNFFEQPFYYQATPTFRVHIPNNVAVGEFHTDTKYGHPDGEITFWLPLTPAFGTNSVWVESAPGTADYHPIIMQPGAMFVFDAGRLRHGNKINRTKSTRISFDFRCIPTDDLIVTRSRSINTGLPFSPGGYYELNPVDPKS